MAEGVIGPTVQKLRARKGKGNAGYRYVAVRGLQESELLDDEEQEAYDGSFGVFEVL
jgi:hypothetical protein